MGSIRWRLLYPVASSCSRRPCKLQLPFRVALCWLCGDASTDARVLVQELRRRPGTSHVFFSRGLGTIAYACGGYIVVFIFSVTFGAVSCWLFSYSSTSFVCC